MSDEPQPSAATAHIWRAVMHLEREHYTKREIAAMLRTVADSVDST